MAKYSNEFKLRVIEFYQKENYGVKNVSNHFNIPSSKLVRRWIKKLKIACDIEVLAIIT